MILMISTCKEKLHELEFVKPIEKILKENNTKYFKKHFKKFSQRDLGNANKIIICGTSLQDNEFIKHQGKFSWITSTKKPVLGICAGHQIISLIFGSELKQKTEIGFYKEKFTKDFLGIKKDLEQQVYHLHNDYIALPKDFEKFTNSKIPQAIKHKEKEIYGVLFHPEVRNFKLISNFISK